jgi:two-component sensor histidine kinase
MIKQFWTTISSIGIDPRDNEKQIKRFTLINQYIFICFLLYLVNGISDLLLGFVYEGVVLELSSLVFIACLYLNKWRHHRITVTFLFIFISLTIFYFGALSGVQSGDYMYYFPLMLSISFALDPQKDKFLVGFLFAFILVLILLNTFVYAYVPAMEPDYNGSRYRMFVVNLMLSAATVGFFIYLTAKNNEMISNLYEQRLKEREESEALIKKTLQEKELLLAELHHRVKNNMAIMAGFFNLKLNNVQNEEARAILLESKNRVSSMALIHNHLYRKDDFSEINFSTYINELVEEIKNSYPGLAKGITVHSNIAEVSLNLNTAIPCALILNELLTNCYKHAFQDMDQGSITIDFFPSGNQELKLAVSDNGCGLKHDFNTRDSMGITVIQALAQQLNGKHTYKSTQGTRFELIFNPILQN